MPKHNYSVYITIALTALFIIVLFGSFYLAFNTTSEPIDTTLAFPVETDSREPILPIPLTVNLDERKVDLGRQLFSDPILSGDGTVSCWTCHNLSLGGTDSLDVSIGINGRQGEINAPTVFNAGYNFRQFWDGRAIDLEDQIDGPLTSDFEMGSSWDDVVSRLEDDETYSQLFSIEYPDGISPNNIRHALATFQESLITPNARFDQYLRGDENAITDEEKRGYQLFQSYGCISCHQGINIGGNLFQRFGIMADYFADRGNITEADYGRFNVTGFEEDRYVFKVPSLRNVELTSPYFHDASVSTLEDAVLTMGYYQLGLNLTDDEIGSIVAFLKTLTGEHPEMNNPAES